MAAAGVLALQEHSKDHSSSRYPPLVAWTRFVFFIIIVYVLDICLEMLLLVFTVPSILHIF